MYFGAGREWHGRRYVQEAPESWRPNGTSAILCNGWTGLALSQMIFRVRFGSARPARGNSYGIGRHGLRFSFDAFPSENFINGRHLYYNQSFLGCPQRQQCQQTSVKYIQILSL